MAGVLAAVVSLEEGGQRLRDLYITAAPGTNAKAIRQEAAALLDRHGVSVPAGSVRIAVLEHVRGAQPGPEQQQSHPYKYPRFLQVLNVETQRTRGQAVCRVSLGSRDQVLYGEAADTDTDAGRARAAARATLQAGELAVPGVRLGLQGLLVLDLAGQRHVALSIEGIANRRYAVLSGIAAISSAVEDAACYAALCAIERWLTA